MTTSQAHLAFSLTERVGSATLSKLMEGGKTAVEAWETYPKKVSRTGGEVDYEREEELAKRYGVRILTIDDEDYPALLRQSPSAPLVLYVKGNVKALSMKSVALVGTRRATVYGRTQANRFAYELCKAGWAVVSGLALGIDAESHRGALDAEGVTVGVIGSGLDRFYPEENRQLAREIVMKGGAVVSQFPFGRSADQTTFPIRNHVVAALSRGVLAIEAPVKSGTLITTSIAADLGRTVMAVPGRVSDRMSSGCLNLIREGATMVRCTDDVLEAILPESERKKCVQNEPVSDRDPESPPYSVEEALVMLHVDEDGISIDELVQKTGLTVEKVNSLTMTLRIKGFVRFLPGNRVAIA